MKCLKTTLDATIADNNMEFIDYLHINVYARENPNAADNGFSVNTENGGLFKILGNGFFSDSTLVVDKGQEMLIDPSIDTTSLTGFKFSNGDYQILLPIDAGYRIFNISSGYYYPQVLNWQIDGFNYQRLLDMNPDLYYVAVSDAPTLLSLKIPNNVTRLDVVKSGLGTPYNGNQLIQYIVESEGRTANFGIAGSGYRDYYGPMVQAVRNIHIITPGTKYQCYNQADTTLLYTAEKINGAWGVVN